MSTPDFAVTFDYRCPFARNAHEHVLDALERDDAAEWNVRFVPFSLSQSKTPSWTRDADSGLLALEVAVAVRDGQPEHFRAVHRALFAARHDQGRHLRDEETLRAVLQETGADPDAAFADVAGGIPAKTVRQEHEQAVSEHEVWGVPTFIAGDQAAFVRLMERPSDSERPAVEVVRGIVDLLTGWPSLNEFKHTALPR